MTVFRCYMMYDFQREFFFLFLKYGIETNTQWIQTRQELEKKLQEQKKKPADEMIENCSYGIFRCKYDKKAKCYYILLCHPKTKVEQQIELLDQIYTLITPIKNYIKIKRFEFEKDYKEKVADLIETAEQQYFKQFGAMEDVQSQTIQKGKKLRQDLIKIINEKQNGIKSDHTNVNEVFDKYINNSDKIFNYDHNKQFLSFMMYDYQRQYFFMFIKRGFQVNEKWVKERFNLEQLLIEQQKLKTIPEFIEKKTEIGIFRAKYDSTQKCYFILLCVQHMIEQNQVELLQLIFEQINKIPKYIKLSKEEIEKKMKQEILDLIDNQENQYLTDFGQMMQRDNILPLPSQCNKEEPNFDVTDEPGMNQSELKAIQIQQKMGNRNEFDT